MRLQVAILRHQLPPVRILFNTAKRYGPGAQRVVTIADLLGALNTFVPLESAGGEWGFEDYIVEAAATSDQEFTYECLHYQEVQDVLQEDDEIVVRALSNDELRERRLGGRLQISNDGRHLIDGLSWGGRWRGYMNRPEFEIPPRKRRRLELEQEPSMPQLEDFPRSHSEPQIGTTTGEDEEEEEDDEDYIDGLEEDDTSLDDGDDNSEQDLGPDERQGMKQLLRLMPSETTDGDSETSDEQHDSFSTSRNELLEEVQGLDENALDVREAEARRMREQRGAWNENQREIEEPSFEGFSSSETPPRKRRRTLMEDTSSQQDKMAGLKANRLRGVTGKGPVESKSPSLSNESASDSSSDDTSSEQDHSSTEDGDSNTETSSSSGSDSSSEVWSAGQDNTADKNLSQDLTLTKGDVLADLSSPEESHSKLLVPPGSGSIRTKRNNIRKKMNKQMNRLKAEGKLDSKATFEDLRVYNQTYEISEPQTAPLQVSIETSDKTLAAKKQEVLARLNGTHDRDDALTNEFTSRSTVKVPAVNGTNHRKAVADKGVDAVLIALPPSTPMPAAEMTTNSPQRKARLDVASSRRMVFNSLGVRPPKTPEAEQALREQLAKHARNIKPGQENSAETSQKQPNQDLQAWKEKLIVSAVECTNRGEAVATPPFPFKQPWLVRKEHSHTRVSLSSPRVDSSQMQNDIEPEMATSQTLAQISSGVDTSPFQALPTSQLNSESHEVPLEDIEHFPPLTKDKLAEQSVIAYKQLQINARFEPEESQYRVARVISVENNKLYILLSEKDLESKIPEYDKETGQRIYSKFEMPHDSEEIEDDGVRELTFDELIRPKIVTLPSDVQIAASFEGSRQYSAQESSQTSSGGQGQATIPESAPEQAFGDIGNMPRADTSVAAGNTDFDPQANDAFLQPTENPESNSSKKSQVTDSYSYQDAQKVPSVAPLLEDSPLMKTTITEDADDGVNSTMASAYMQTKETQTSIFQHSSDDEYNTPSPKEDNIVKDSQLVRHDSDHGDDESEASLPSLNTLSSSQHLTKASSKSPARLSQLSAPTTRRSLRSQDKNQLLSPMSHSNAEQSSPESAFEASQAPEVPQSQVSKNGDAIDLTFSSDPVQPNGSTFHDSENSQSERRQTRRSKKETGSFLENRSFKSSLSGLGSKRTLTSKKTVSQTSSE